MSCGLDVEKRIRILGFANATMSNNLAKSTAVAFCISVAFLKSFFNPPPYHK